MAEVPGQISGEGLTVTTGLFFTVIVTVFELAHPFKAVPVTVYVVVLSGLAFTVLPVLADKPVEGDQL